MPCTSSPGKARADHSLQDDALRRGSDEERRHRPTLQRRGRVFTRRRDPRVAKDGELHNNPPRRKTTSTDAALSSFHPENPGLAPPRRLAEPLTCKPAGRTPPARRRRHHLAGATTLAADSSQRVRSGRHRPDLAPKPCCEAALPRSQQPPHRTPQQQGWRGCHPAPPRRAGGRRGPSRRRPRRRQDAAA